jgi:drug/metabolite transporter (DMT)-like permease
MIALKQGKENLHSVLLMAGAAVLWSLGGIFIKSIDANPMAIAGVRSGIAALLILAFLRKPKFTFSFPQVAAALAYSATVFLYVGANKTTTAANAILLQFTSPVYVALLGAWILKEKAKAFDWIIIAMVFAGMTLFFLDKLSPEGMLGNILAILSGVSFALFTIFMRKQKKALPSSPSLWAIF